MPTLRYTLILSRESAMSRFRMVSCPMRSVGEAVGGTVNKVYRVYEKAL